MATIRKTIDVSSGLTDKQLAMIKEAENTAYVYDEDSPLLSKDELASFKRVSSLIKDERKSAQKQNVTLRLPPKTLLKAKSLGKGYTGILAKIIEKALDNPELTELLMK